MTITSSIGQEVDIIAAVRTRAGTVWPQGYPPSSCSLYLVLQQPRGLIWLPKCGQFLLPGPYLYHHSHPGGRTHPAQDKLLGSLVVGDLLGIILLLILGYSDVASIFAADGLLAPVPSA